MKILFIAFQYLESTHMKIKEVLSYIVNTSKKGKYSEWRV